jgi:hypothetical protein
MKLTYETRKPLIATGQGDVSELTLFDTSADITGSTQHVDPASRSRIANATTSSVGPAIHSEAANAIKRLISRGVT